VSPDRGGSRRGSLSPQLEWRGVRPVALPLLPTRRARTYHLFLIERCLRLNARAG
jgi:hypothetical protein